MDNDRGLLELAARANNITIKWSPVKLNWDGSHPIYWNPLVEDAHAFRLAASLGISVTPYPIYDEPKHSVLAIKKRLFPLPDDSVIEAYGTDPCAATRRAIVRAAADIAQRQG